MPSAAALARVGRIALLAFSLAGVAHAEPATRPAASAPAPLFDPARHMRVSEVRPGMKGYGLTVLSGTAISQFPVEVLSVLRGTFGPGQDIVMIRCTDEFMRHVGPIAGCSGSPVYLYGTDGQARLIGAYALGYDMARDPIVGVQPIEQMLTLAAPPPGATSRPAGENLGPARVEANAAWSLLDVDAIPWLPKRAGSKSAPAAPVSQPGWRPLAVPLAVRGVGAAAVIERLAPRLRAAGFEPLAAPTTAGGVDPATTANVAMQPGSVLAGVMLSGDLEMTALGTCTEVIDGRAFGFGHPFNGEGATSVPMAAGAVNLVMPTLVNSFKMGAAGPVLGTIDNDGAYGVAGQIGAAAHTFPITVTIDDDTTGHSRTFHFRSALHRLFSPIVAGGAVEASLTADKPLPAEHTVRYDVRTEFDNGQTLTQHNVETSLDQTDLAKDVAWPIQMMMNNPYANVGVRGVTAHARITGNVEADQIDSASLDRPAHEPGETARLIVRVRPFRGETYARTVDVPIPKSLPEGDYPLIVGDATTNLAAVAQSEPYRFQVRTAGELFAGLQTIATLSNNSALYVRLNGTSAGLAIGRTPLDKLPPSRRAILEAAARPDASALAGSRAIVVPTPRAVIGSATATLHVKKKLP